MSMSSALNAHARNASKMASSGMLVDPQAFEQQKLDVTTRGQDLAIQKARMDDATTRRGQTADYGLKRMELGSQNPLMMGGVSSMRSALDSSMFGTSKPTTVPTTFGMRPGSIGGWNTSVTGSSLLNEQGMARGGAVNGPGPVGVDSVPARLAPGEYVLPPQTVQALGGPRSLNQLVRSTTGREPGATMHPDGRQGLSAGGPPIVPDDVLRAAEGRAPTAAEVQAKAQANARGPAVRPSPTYSPPPQAAPPAAPAAPAGGTISAAEARANLRTPSQANSAYRAAAARNARATAEQRFAQAGRGARTMASAARLGVPVAIGAGAALAVRGARYYNDHTEFDPENVSVDPAFLRTVERIREEQAAPPREVSDIPAVPGTWAADTPTEQRTEVARQAQNPRPPAQGDYNFQVVPEGTLSPLGTPTEMAVDEAKRLSANARNVYNSESPILRRGNVFTNDPTWQPYVENAGATQSLGAAYTGEPRKPREPTARERMEQNIRFQPYETQVAMRAQFDQREQAQAHERAQQQLVNDSYIANTRAGFENPATQAQAELIREQLTGLRELREREARERAKQPTREAIQRAGGTEVDAEESLLEQNPEQAAQAEAARRQMEANNLKRVGWGNDPRPGQVDPATMRYTGRENRGFGPWLGQALGWAWDAPGYGQVEVMDDLGNTYWTDLDDPIMETMRQRSIRSATR